MPSYFKRDKCEKYSLFNRLLPVMRTFNGVLNKDTVPPRPMLNNVYPSVASSNVLILSWLKTELNVIKE